MISLTRRPSSSPWRGLTVAASPVLVLAMALSACSGDGDEADAPGSSDSPAAGATDSPSDGTEGSEDAEGSEDDDEDKPDLPKAPAIVKPQGATEDVTTRGTCGLKPGKQNVGGQVANPTKRALDYVITVSWVSDDGRVRGRGVAVVEDVPPGGRKPWKAKADVLDDASACVTNALRGRAKS